VKLKLVGYIRVSRVGGREGDSFISPAVQKEQVAALALARGHEVVEWIVDLDESGGKWERPGFQRALEMVERGEVNGVAVAKLDRFARSVVDGLRGIERITVAGGQFVSVAESFDTTTPMGKAMLQISLVFAELERERQRDGFRVSTTHAIASGIHISTLVPTGYRRGEDRRLVIVKREARIVHEIFVRRAQGASWSELARLLDKRLPRPNGGAWARTTIVKLIKNRAYLGEAHQGEIVKRGAHAAIVSRAEFEAAQPRTSEPLRRSGSLLVGILHCGSCGLPLHRATSLDYGCRARRSDGVCPAPVTIKIAKADAEVVRVFREWADRQDVAFRASRGTNNATKDLTRTLELAESELEAYRDETLVSVIGREAYAAGLTKRQSVVDEVQHALATAQASNAPLGRYDIASVWPRLDAAARRRMISSAIESVIVKASGGKTRPVADRLRIVWQPGQSGRSRAAGPTGPTRARPRS
jgi:site-specific DNA recombinase